MKKLLKATLVIAMLFIANITMNADVNQQNDLIYNQEEVDGVVVSETVFRLVNGTLTNYMKHHYKYDENKQRIEDQAMKWDSVKEEWRNDLCIRYTYNETTITTEYYKWNKKKKDYVLVPEMTITMDK